jgi:hypothetical protein
MVSMDTEPSNFYPNLPYPLAGERIGPAWRLMWRELSPRWQEAQGLCQRVAQRSEVTESTLRKMLRKAASRKIIEYRLTGHLGNQRAEYRVVS